MASRQTEFRLGAGLMVLAVLVLVQPRLCAQEAASSAEALLKQGNELSHQDRWKEAIDAYRKALEVKPDYAQAHYNLANAYTGDQKTTDAIHEYREVLRLKPEFPGVHMNLGALFETQGELAQ
ncbi:MAG: hypothetical protein DMG26_14030, partial [Acidobacteria bacterium]